jgi:hypothetical protein
MEVLRNPPSKGFHGKGILLNIFIYTPVQRGHLFLLGIWVCWPPINPYLKDRVSAEDGWTGINFILSYFLSARGLYGISPTARSTSWEPGWEASSITLFLSFANAP